MLERLVESLKLRLSLAIIRVEQAFSRAWATLRARWRKTVSQPDSPSPSEHGEPAAKKTRKRKPKR